MFYGRQYMPKFKICTEHVSHNVAHHLPKEERPLKQGYKNLPQTKIPKTVKENFKGNRLSKSPALLNLSVEESVDKGSRVVEVQYPDSHDVGRIMVTGYDTSLERNDVKSALEKHFSSCGKITDVYIPITHSRGLVLKSTAYIYFMGEVAADKALLLNGSDLRGWKLSVEAFPFDEFYTIVIVDGIDPMLPSIIPALSEHFSSCGKIIQVHTSGDSLAHVYIEGHEAAEKASQLVETSLMGGLKLVLVGALKKGRPIFHPRPKGRRLGPPRPNLQDQGEKMDIDGEQGSSKNGIVRSESSKTKSAEKKHIDGFQIKILCMGNSKGKKAKSRKLVSVRYIGKLLETKEIFDSNIGKSPFKFRLGVGQVIDGMDVGVKGMRVGENRELIIPPSMGYGKEGAGNKIPPNAWLKYTIELFDVQ